MLLAVSMADAESHTHAAFIDDDPVPSDLGKFSSNTCSFNTASLSEETSNDEESNRE